MTKHKKNQIEVVAAIIEKEQTYLAVQRGEHKHTYVSLKWEFPGGKVEPGESLKAAIQRELKEELHVEVSNLELLVTVNHEYPDFHITMHCFLCNMRSDKVTLTEHIDARWLKHDELWSVDWAPADIPAVEALESQAKAR